MFLLWSWLFNGVSLCLSTRHLRWLVIKHFLVHSSNPKPWLLGVSVCLGLAVRHPIDKFQSFIQERKKKKKTSHCFSSSQSVALWYALLTNQIGISFYPCDCCSTIPIHPEWGYGNRSLALSNSAQSNHFNGFKASRCTMHLLSRVCPGQFIRRSDISPSEQNNIKYLLHLDVNRTTDGNCKN